MSTSLASQLSESTPTLDRSAPHLVVGGSAVVWGRQGVTALHPVTTLMLPYLDGRTNVGELWEDAVAALDAKGEECLLAVEADLVTLAQFGLIEGLVDSAARGPCEERDGEAVRRTVVVTLDSTGAGALPELLGNASLTDLVDDGNCVGQRLRAGWPADELAVIVDGEPARIRCDHAAVSAELQRRLHRHLCEPLKEPGPIVAYVVAPWEGSGPVRIYDRWARRVGRPRTVAEAADTVGVLLAERTEPPGGGGVTVHATVVEDEGGSCALVDERLAEAPGFHRKIRNAGWVIRPNRRVVIDPRGAVVIEEPLPDSGLAFRRLGGVIVVEPDGTAAQAAAISALLNGIAAATPQDALAALHHLDTTLARTPVLGARREAEAILSLLSALLERPNPA
jgi:hypothetical protein